MKGLTRKRVTLNLKINLRRPYVSAFSVVLLWFLVSINNMKKTRIDLSDSSRKIARHLEVEGRPTSTITVGILAVFVMP